MVNLDEWGISSKNDSADVPAEPSSERQSDSSDSECSLNRENVDRSNSRQELPRRSEHLAAKEAEGTKRWSNKGYIWKVVKDDTKEPMTWEEMLQLPIKEREKWMEAVNVELMSLEKHKVWEIADLPPGKRTISAKWVFKAKHDDQGNIHTYKARLVARGFSQIHGRDYDETFAPVVRHETVRILFAVAAMKKMHVRHIDVKTAYLNGKLDEELYLEPPAGFDQPTTGGKVLRLRRSLYGLKQSARVWNQVASDALRKLGFRPNSSNTAQLDRVEMTAIGSIAASDAKNATSWEVCTERLECYCEANNITDDSKKRATLLTVIGSET
uniref:Reverse transcriptase Ty1/copia-type domain-containing protein n=1 Tax=Trichuris muris TaxID=70415 RepID=A0A5S6QZ02_TRIMR